MLKKELERTLEAQIEELDRVPPGSESYKEVTNTIDKLTKDIVELEKIENEKEELALNQYVKTSQVENEIKKNKSEKRYRWGSLAVSLIVPIAVGIYSIVREEEHIPGSEAERTSWRNLINFKKY